MTFSVVIPLFNKRQTIKRAIESALNQTLPPIEVIVVDDGSSDGSPEIVAEFGPPVRLIKQANAGPAAARNHGARLCSGDYLIFLDGDDELGIRALEEHAACLVGHSAVDISLASFRKIEANGQTNEVSLTRRVDFNGDRFVYLTHFSTASVVHIVANGICIARSLFEKIAGFDEALRCWEITDFLMRASLAATTVGLHRDASVITYELPNNSQFARTRAVSEYRLRFACTIAACLAKMPEPAKTEMAAQALGFAYSLWEDGYLREYKVICSHLAQSLGPEHRGARLYRISRLPEIILKPLYMMRKIMSRFGKPENTK